jgi:hypothetical protein
MMDASASAALRLSIGWRADSGRQSSSRSNAHRTARTARLLSRCLQARLRGHRFESCLLYRSPHWVKVKTPNAPAVRRETEQACGKSPFFCDRRLTRISFCSGYCEPRMGSDPRDCISFRSESPKIVQRAIWPCYLHPPRLAVVPWRQNRAAAAYSQIMAKRTS